MELKTNNVIITEEGTSLVFTPAFGYRVYKTQIADRRKIARKILDDLSKDYNSLGIDGIIAMLIAETYGNEYKGKKNEYSQPSYVSSSDEGFIQKN